MVTCSVLTMVSGLLGTKVFIPSDNYFQKLYTNLWILCIAKSGQFKTTALNKGANLAYKRQSELLIDIKRLQEEFKFSEESQKHKIHVELITKSLENIILPTKITSEGLIEHLAQGHKGVIYASEFGIWLQNLEKTQNNDLKGIFTELYDVPLNWRYKTKTQGDFILEEPFFLYVVFQQCHG